MESPRFVKGDQIIESFMAFVDSVLYEFKGQLSLQDIYGMTYKELGYLRNHREKIYEAKAKHAGIGDALAELAY